MKKLCIYDLTINEFSGFSFSLPFLTDNGNSIIFTVDYELGEVLEFNVWLQVGDSLMKGLIYKNSIQSGSDITQRIIDAVNDDKIFMDTLQEYIDILELYAQNML